MPRPSLTEEIDALRAMCRLLPSVRRLRDRQDRAEEILDSVVSRLTALATELEGERARRRRLVLKLADERARWTQRPRDWSRLVSAMRTRASVGRSEGDCAESDRAISASGRSQPSDLAASHPCPSGLPCSSAFLNAQTGYDDEDGG